MIPAKNPERGAFIVVDDEFEGHSAETSPTGDDLDPAVGDRIIVERR